MRERIEGVVGREAAEVAGGEAIARGCVVPVLCRCEGVGDGARVVARGEPAWHVVVNLVSSAVWFGGGLLLAWWLHRRGFVGGTAAVLIASAFVGFGLLVGVMMVFSRGVRRRVGARLGRVLFVDRDRGGRFVGSDACDLRVGVSGARLIVFEGRVGGRGARYGVGVVRGADGVCEPIGVWTHRSVGRSVEDFAKEIGIGFERRGMPGGLVLDRTTMQTVLLGALRG